MARFRSRTVVFKIFLTITKSCHIVEKGINPYTESRVFDWCKLAHPRQRWSEITPNLPNLARWSFNISLRRPPSGVMEIRLGFDPPSGICRGEGNKVARETHSTFVAYPTDNPAIITEYLCPVKNSSSDRMTPARVFTQVDRRLAQGHQRPEPPSPSAVRMYHMISIIR